MNIQMVDLKTQHEKFHEEIESGIIKAVREGNFINGHEVERFANKLSEFLGGAYVIPCANGTDALQIAMMALNLKPGDEVIVPSFTYVATAEVIGLLNLIPVMVDVDINNFNISTAKIENAIGPKTKAIVPVHLFGQCVDMERIMAIARKYSLYIIEDTAQAIGAKFKFSDGTFSYAGTIGDIGCTSFFPSKNLGCYGDGGAIFTRNEELALRLKMIANHGQEKKYVHKYIGVNSRLDTIQASILNVKLKYLHGFIKARQDAADNYNQLLKDIVGIKLPNKESFSSHVFHQYTLIVENGKRDALKKHLDEMGVPSMIYYPIPLFKQEAYSSIGELRGSQENTEFLCNSVLSLPMHTELTQEQMVYITNSIKSFFC
jgi:UDP-2-acetamido-2-deoxy-ribo-hexuluronate aminotransferase